MYVYIFIYNIELFTVCSNYGVVPYQVLHMMVVSWPVMISFTVNVPEAKQLHVCRLVFTFRSSRDAANDADCKCNLLHKAHCCVVFLPKAISTL